MTAIRPSFLFMSANLPRPSTDENVSTTLSAGITDVGGSMDVADASKIVAPCYLVIDRVDSSGTLKDENLWEYVKVTNVASNTLTITRAQGGSTGQAHGSGAVVEAVMTSSFMEDWYAVLNPEHDSAGGHVISTATIATAVIGTHLNAQASITGIPLVPVFAFVGSLGGATTLVQTPLVMPRTGTWSFANFWTRTVASGVSAIVDINKNGVSIFDTIGRPMIAAGGTFVSTASIATRNFTRGDRISWDYDGTSGSITDFDVMLVSL